MNDKEKYSAVIDARIAKLGETLNDIKTKRELRKEYIPCNAQDVESSTCKQ